MLSRRSMCRIVIFFLCSSCLLFGQQQSLRSPHRDLQSVDILSRVAQAAGGGQALASIRDITESGEITFYWGENVKGPVTIRTLGGNHFRMEADLPQGKSTLIVKDGVGSKTESEKTIPISRENAINLGNLTYPVGLVAAALADSATDVSFVGIEKREGRSVYRLRIKGQLGLVSEARMGGPVVKDLLINALDFDIVSVEDRPFPVPNTSAPSNSSSRQNSEKKISAPPSREIEFSDFRVIRGVRVPFSVSTKLMGQQMLSLQLREVTFNNNLSASDFQVQK